MTRTLSQWLEYQQQVHPQTIALGLDRVRTVAERLGLALRRPAPLVITVAGTNGKGSCVAILRHLLEAAGLRVGCYTSPHLLHYSERIALPDGPVAEGPLLAWFARIEAARRDVPLTFFEYGTLAALGVFSASDLDAVVLEVGLGGRLDAVNLVAADAALITTIDLDHQDWLGPDRETIGREKAGVLRPGQLAVYADPNPVRSVLDVAGALGTRLLRPAFDYRFWRGVDNWFLHDGQGLNTMPWPPELLAPAQIHNLAACVTLTGVLARPEWRHDWRQRGLTGIRVPARLQRLAEAPELVLDIAHNPQAARSLAQWLQQAPLRHTVALFGALSDKDVSGIVDALAHQVASWVLVGLEGETPRGLPASSLAARMPAGVAHEPATDLVQALARARERAGPDGRVLAFGSFYLAAALLRVLTATERIPFLSKSK